MPALMNSVNTRSTRSRYSSPAITPGQSGSGSGESVKAHGSASNTTGVDAQKSFMQRWLEPPVQIKASYQDDGLVRHGVVENMAPLGTMPKVGLFKKTAPLAAAIAPATEQVKPTKIIVIKRAPVPAPSTPTPAPPVAAAPAAPEEDETEEEEGEDLVGSDGEDYDGEGTPVHAAGSSRRSLPSRAGDSSRDEEWGTGKPSPSYNSVSRRSASRASIGTGQYGSGSFPPLPQSTQNTTAGFSESRELCDKVVEASVDQALHHFRYPTAWALRTLYDENFDNPQFIAMIEKVFNQTADAETLAEFTRIMHERKTEGQKDNKLLCDYWGLQPSHTDPPHSFKPPHKPIRGPYGDLITLDTSILHLGIKRESESEARSEPQDKAQDKAPVDAGQQSEPEPEREQEAVPKPEAEPASEPQVLEPQPEPEPELEAVLQSEPESATVLQSELDPQREPEPAPEPEPTKGQPGPEPEPEAETKPTPTPASASVATTQTRRQKHKQLQEPEGDIHVRKKRRSTRHSAFASTAAKMTPNGVDSKPKAESPLKRRARAHSISSTSSLSSAQSMSPPTRIDHDGDEVMTEDGDLLDRPSSRDSPAAERERKRERNKSAPAPAAPPQPITKRTRRANAVKKNGNVSPATLSLATSPTSQAQTQAQDTAQSPPAHEQPYDMPEVVDTPQFPGNKKGNNNGIVFQSKVGKIDENDANFLLRQSARKITSIPPPDGISYVRNQDLDGNTIHPELDIDEPPAVFVPLAPSHTAFRSTPTASNTRSTRSSRKRSHDDVEEQASPTALNFASEVASTAANSRAGTPALRASKKPRTGLRIKTS